jgi:hypothetical protein
MKSFCCRDCRPMVCALAAGIDQSPLGGPRRRALGRVPVRASIFQMGHFARPAYLICGALASLSSYSLAPDSTFILMLGLEICTSIVKASLIRFGIPLRSTF